MIKALARSLVLYVVPLLLVSCSVDLPRGDYDSTYWDQKAALCTTKGGFVGKTGTSVGGYFGDRLIFDYDGYCYLDLKGKVPLNSL